VGPLFETYTICNDYNQQAGAITKKSKSLKYIQNELKKKQSTPTTVTKDFRTRSLTDQEKKALGEKIDGLSEAIKKKDGELTTQRNKALFQTGGVILQNTLTLPGAGPLVSGGLSAASTYLFEESEDRAEKAVKQGLVDTTKEVVLSAIEENSRCSIQ